MDGLAAFEQNSTGFFRELPRHMPNARYWHEDGLFIGLTNWNLSAFNNAFILDEYKALPYHIERIREIFAADNLPYSVIAYSRGPVPMCEGLLKEHGFFNLFTDQIMIREGPLFPLQPHIELNIQPVTNASEQTQFMGVVANAFNLPLAMPVDLFDELLRIPLFKPMLAYLDGEAVASGMLLYCQDIAAVYNVGTIAAMRNKGIGTAMMTALHQRALTDGFSATVLASTPTGFSLYQHLGYRLDGYQTTYASAEYLNGP